MNIIILSSRTNRKSGFLTCACFVLLPFVFLLNASPVESPPRESRDPFFQARRAMVERDLRARPLDAAALVGMAREHLHADSAYEAQAHWDLWVYDSGLARWQRRPQRLEITCFGEEYDDGVYAEAGHFQVDAGFEHLFTGHAGLLGFYGQAVAPPQHPTEAEFLSAMASPENLREYHERTRENIRKLLDWMRQVQSALPIERYSLWSEGEENFEARVDEILALR